MYKLPPAERGRSILYERHKRETYDIHRKKVACKLAPCAARACGKPPACTKPARALAYHTPRTYSTAAACFLPAQTVSKCYYD